MPEGKNENCQKGQQGAGQKRNWKTFFVTITQHCHERAAHYSRKEDKFPTKGHGGDHYPLDRYLSGKDKADFKRGHYLA